MRALKIVVRGPFADSLSGMDEIEEQGLVQQFVAHTPVEALDEAVLHWLSRSDEVPVHVHILAPGEHGVAGELGAVVADNHAWFATPIDDRCQFARNAPSRDRGVGDRTQTFLGDVIDDVQNAEAPATGELIVDKIQRPARIGLGLHQYWRPRANGLAASSASAHGQAFFPIEAMDTIDA